MPKSTPIAPTVISSTTLQRDFGAIVRRVHNNKERFIVERNGFSMMVILPVSDYEALSQPETEK